VQIIVRMIRINKNLKKVSVIYNQIYLLKYIKDENDNKRRGHERERSSKNQSHGREKEKYSKYQGIRKSNDKRPSP